MAANISVTGMPRPMGGLKESQVAFRKHHIEVGDALLNIGGVGTVTGEPVDKDEPRMPYVYQGFPKMIFHAEKGEHIVMDQDELDTHLHKGWRMDPYPKVIAAVQDPKVEKAQLEAKLKQKDGEIATLADTLQKAMSRLDAIEEKAQNEKPAKSK